MQHSSQNVQFYRTLTNAKDAPLKNARHVYFGARGAWLVLGSETTFKELPKTDLQLVGGREGLRQIEGGKVEGGREPDGRGSLPFLAARDFKALRATRDVRSPRSLLPFLVGIKVAFCLEARATILR